MRKVILYIATSLDGKIADGKGAVGWLEDIPVIEGEDYGYGDFVQSVDTVVMGNKTYQQVMSFDMPYPYADKHSYVISRSEQTSSADGVTFVKGDVNSLVQSLKSQKGKDIWLVGGGAVNALFCKSKLIDEIICFVMPVVLGEGISMFGDEKLMQQLRLTFSRSLENGVVELRYKLK